MPPDTTQRRRNISTAARAGNAPRGNVGRLEKSGRYSAGYGIEAGSHHFDDFREIGFRKQSGNINERARR